MDWIVEFVVREMYGRARLDMSEPCGAVRLAIAILGSQCIRVVPARSIPGRAALAWSERGAAMYIGAGLTPAQVNVAVAHELAEWKLKLWGYAEGDVEAVAVRIAAALCVPRLAFERARLHLGNSIPGLSRWFGVSRPLMALRVAECAALSPPSSARSDAANHDQLGPITARPPFLADQLRLPKQQQGRHDLLASAQEVAGCPRLANEDFDQYHPDHIAAVLRTRCCRATYPAAQAQVCASRKITDGCFGSRSAPLPGVQRRTLREGLEHAAARRS